jgi:mono/diheme cytochrome c family protein
MQKKSPKKKLIEKVGLIIAILLGGFILIQLIPYGHNHTNPPVVTDIKWDSPHTKELAQRACFDCHSNETVWPWYSNIAPGSWLIYSDVMEGRSRLNFSEWVKNSHRANEATEIVLEGEMPPFQYLLIHKNAILTSSEREGLAKGLAVSLGQ